MDVHLGFQEKGNLEEITEETLLVYEETVATDEDTEVVERLIGFVEDGELKEPSGKVTRLREESDHDFVDAERRLKPAGEVPKANAEEVLWETHARMPGKFSQDHGSVRDVDSF